MKKIIYYWFPFIVWGFVIFYLSSRPLPTPPLEVENIDLLWHALFYALLSFFLGRALQIRGKNKMFFLSMIAVLFTTVYGVLNEVYQAYVPTRSSSFSDGVANFLGAFIGIIVYHVFYRWRSYDRRS